MLFPGKLLRAGMNADLPVLSDMELLYTIYCLRIQTDGIYGLVRQQRNLKIAHNCLVKFTNENCRLACAVCWTEGSILFYVLMMYITKV